MSDKKLTLSTSLDTTLFDTSVRKMQQDLAKINAQAAQIQAQGATAGRAQGMGYGGLNAPSQQAYEKATQNARRGVDSKIREEIQFQEKLSKIISDRQSKLDVLQRHQESLVKGSKEELDVKQKIARVEENNYRLRESYKQRDQNLNTLLDAKQKEWSNAGGGPGGPPNGNGGGPASTGPDFGGLLKQIGGATAIATMITKSISTGLTVYRAYGESPLKASVNQGNAMSGTFGSELQNAYSGRSGIESAYLPEKGAADMLAQQNLANRKTHDTASIYGRIGGAGAAGALGGSFFGPVGSAIGLAGGIAAGGASVLMDPRLRARALGETSSTFSKEYESMNAREYAENYQTGLQSEKAKNPLKTMALEDYQNNYQKNLEFQRATGLNYNSFHGAGGFREQSVNAGFTDQMGMGMSSSILGAGGSTRSAQENSVLGLQMQRGMGMTNAGGILGQISSSMGSGQSTREATIKLMSEGTRLGLDSSQFREENRKFSESAAEVIARTGTSSGEGVDSILDRFGRFMTDKTEKGIESGKGAYEMYQQLTSSTSGPTGVMRLSGMLKDQKLGGMAATDRAALMQMPAEQMTTDNPTIQDVATRNNMEPKDLISRMNKVNSGGLHRLSRADELQKQLSGVVDQIGGRSIDDTYALSPETRKAFGEYRTLVGVENPGLASDPRKQTAFAEGTLGVSQTEQRKAAQAAVEGELGNKNTGIAEDRTVQQTAEGSRLMLENFQKLGPTIGASTEAIKAYNVELLKQVEIISKMPEADRNSLFSKMFPAMFPNNQNQGGKPSK